MATPSSTRFRQHLYSNPGTPRTYASTAVDAGQTTPPSLSATVPFDWEAARNGGPAPYGNAGTPIGTKPKVGKGRKSNVDGVTRNRVVRQAGWFERLVIANFSKNSTLSGWLWQIVGLAIENAVRTSNVSAKPSFTSP